MTDDRITDPGAASQPLAADGFAAPPAPERGAGETTGRALRILWISKRPTSGGTGDEVFDRKTIAACRAAGCAVTLHHPDPVGRWRGMAALASGWMPFQRHRFDNARNRRAILTRSAGADLVVCSWEPFDALVRRLPKPCLLIAHNITSQSLPKLYPRSVLARLAAWRMAGWERRWYHAARFAAIGVLSRRDLATLAARPDYPPLLLLPPGMPPCVELRDDAVVGRELVVAGTFDWRPKRRDVIQFARDYARIKPRLPVRGEGLPPEAQALLRPRALPTAEQSARVIRFGLITDRFDAGHKLKTLAYIADNQIVLSFADVSFDFAHIADHALFIHRIASVADIAPLIERIAAIPPETLRARFKAFQSACATAFTWAAVADTLTGVLLTR